MARAFVPCFLPTYAHTLTRASRAQMFFFAKVVYSRNEKTTAPTALYTRCPVPQMGTAPFLQNVGSFSNKPLSQKQTYRLGSHTLTHSAQRHCEGNSSQIINSRLNHTLYTSKAQTLHTWMDPYLRCGTLRYTPRYRAHPDTHNRYSLSRRGVRRVAYRQARPSITRDPSRLGSGTEKACLLAVRGPAWRFMHDAGKVLLGMARSGNRPPRPARHAHGGLRISRSS